MVRGSAARNIIFKKIYIKSIENIIDYLDLVVMPDPDELDLAAMPDSRALGLITMSDPCLGLEMLANSRLVLTTILDSCLDLIPNIVAKPKTQRSWV